MLRKSEKRQVIRSLEKSEKRGSINFITLNANQRIKVGLLSSENSTVFGVEETQFNDQVDLTFHKRLRYYLKYS